MTGEARASAPANWDRIPADHRKVVVGAIYVEREATAGLARLIDKLRTNRQFLREPSCILITGDTGTGKSRFLTRYHEAHPARRIGGRIRRPVLLAELPVRATMPGAATALLEGLGDPGANRGKLVDQTFRVQRLTKDQEVEAVLIDEFQHIVEASGERTINKVGDWLKQLAKSANVPLILAGMPNSAAVLDANKQFAGICPYRFVLDGFGKTTVAERKAFRQFLALIDAQLPFNHLSRLGEQIIADALFVATKGSLRQLARLLQEAAFHAIDRCAPSIETGDLAFGFQTVELLADLDHNPFDELDGTGTGRN